MQIRPYRDTDWPTVREIYDLAKPDELRGVVDASAIPPLEVDPDMKLLFRESHILVMDDVDGIVGFGGSRGTFITWLFVHPNHRRKGVASALIREMLAQLNGTITLNVATTNAAACNLYKRMGFTVEREFIGKFNGRACPGRQAALRESGLTVRSTRTPAGGASSAPWSPVTLLLGRSRG
jgi:ribosomal protein S18 acetylase RimI-like enzyme